VRPRPQRFSHSFGWDATRDAPETAAAAVRRPIAVR
jgi:hypothetical protein